MKVFQKERKYEKKILQMKKRASSPRSAEMEHTGGRRSKEATYLELCRSDGRARLVVIAGEVGGRWSQETKDFLWCLACEVVAGERQSWMVQEVVLSPCVLNGKGSGLFSGWAPRIPGVR